MRIAITINDVIRDFTLNFNTLYEDYLLEETELSETENIDDSDPELKNSNIIELGENDEVISEVGIFEKVERKMLNLDGSIDPMYITHSFEFKDVDEFNDMFYGSLALNVNGRNGPINQLSMTQLNKLYFQWEDLGYDVTLISLEKGNSKPATFFFLCKEKCQVNKIRFYQDYAEVWEDYDQIITADDYIIEKAPKNKTCYKVLTQFNKDMKTKKHIKTINNLSELYEQQ